MAFYSLLVTQQDTTMDSLPTLPTNPQPIDYEIQKFVEWGTIDSFSDMAHLFFMGEKTSGPAWFCNNAQIAINELYSRVRPHFQAFADALAQQPIEVDGLVWAKGVQSASASFMGIDLWVELFVEGEIDSYYGTKISPDGYGVVVCERGERRLLDNLFVSVEEAMEALEIEICAMLSAQLNRPVVVKKP